MRLTVVLVLVAVWPAWCYFAVTAAVAGCQRRDLGTGTPISEAELEPRRV